MHGFIIVLLREEEAQQGKAHLLHHIEKIVYPYKRAYDQGDERVCGCADETGAANPNCEDCKGTGKSPHNPNGKLDYWVLGGRYEGFIRNGKIDPQKSIGDFFTELINFMSSSSGNVLPDSSHSEIDTNVVPIDHIHLNVLREVWITPDHGWVENIFNFTDDPRQKYKDHWVAGIDYHS